MSRIVLFAYAAVGFGCVYDAAAQAAIESLEVHNWLYRARLVPWRTEQPPCHENPWVVRSEPSIYEGLIPVQPPGSFGVLNPLYRPRLMLGGIEQPLWHESPAVQWGELNLLFTAKK